MLLKATHSPFLALIILYEKLSTQWRNDVDQRWRIGRASGSKALGLPQRLGRSQTQLDDPEERTAGLGDGSRREAVPASHDELASLARLVADLRGQIDRLELRLGAQE